MAQWQVEDCSPEASPKHLGSRPVSQEKQRAGTGRFNAEELQCFKRVPTPSRPNRLEQDGARRSRSESTLSGVTPSKDGGDSQFLLLGDLTPSRLPQEDSTARVLDQIFPRTTGAFGELVPEQSERRQRLERSDAPRRTKRTLTSSLSSSNLEAAQQAHERKQKIGMDKRILQFRQRIIEKFMTMKSAFDAFANENSSVYTKELSRKDFKRFLNKHFHGLSPEEQDNVFDFIDQDKSGYLSMSEFHSCLESAAPVRNMEDLRRKLIALGHTSMRQAIQTMAESLIQPWENKNTQTSARRLELPEFGAALSKVGLTDEEEQQCLFTSISEPNESKTVSLDELHSSIAAVSPSLLIEDIRDKLIKKFGTLDMAYTRIDLDDNSRLTAQEFVRHCVVHLKMTTHEAMKAFAIIDLDGNGWISRCEFLSALRLSEPSLFLEDLRKKVRQRFRSIRDAFGHDEAEVSTFDNIETTEEVKKSPHNVKQNKAFRRGSILHKDSDAKTAAALHLFLSSVQFSESDTKMLFDLVDIDKEGKLTSLEFVRGIKLFAPSCILEDLRLQCLRNASRCRDAFKRVKKYKEVVMDLKTFKKMLEDLKLDTGVNVEAVFYLVESRRDGGLALGELFAALHSGAPGMQMPLPPEQRDAKARQQVKWQMAPFHRNAGELRSSVRQKPDGDAEPPRVLPMGLVNDPRSYVTSSSLHQRRLSRSSPDKLRGTSASEGFLNAALGGPFGGISSMYSTAPSSMGYGLSALGAAGHLQSTPDRLGASPGGFSAPSLRDPLGGASPRSPSTPSSFPRLGDSLPTPGSPKKAAAMDADLGGRGQSPARLVGQSPARQQRSPSPRTPIKKRDSFMHAPTKQSYKKISSLVANCDASFDRKPMLDKLHGYYMTAGQTIADDLSLTERFFSRAQHYQAASCHRAALARSV
mmetsp:Transcript_41593/g.77416  ORF Transcript_41593/g.77416 Transcript_41593/m.77416 type:complete len:923 (-) Transcript_41593:91-2859(-)